MQKAIRKIQDLELKGKRVFVRVDFNVPLKHNGKEWIVSDPKRIEGALETIRHVIASEGKCILASHLGRPKGKREGKYSLEPVGAKLSELLGKDVILTDDCIGDGAKSLSLRMRNGDILLLENLRFHEGEEENSPDFVAKLLELTDVYVNDAFGTMHRAHASTVGLPKMVQERGAGFLVQKELQYLSALRDKPERPFMLIMGGAKVSDKMGILELFLPKVDKVFIGGAMAYAFLKAQGHEIGKSLCDEKQEQLASKILKSADARKVKVILPVDHVVSRSIQDVQGKRITESVDIEKDFLGVDIGPKTLELFQQEIQGAKTIFWNGPMGVFEQPEFSKGTFELARIIAGTSALKLAGGGDSAAAITQSGSENQFNFISTGGGATLEYLEGKEFAGLKVLEFRLPNEL
jgi:phosphoglycerate kinase